MEYANETQEGKQDGEPPKQRSKPRTYTEQVLPSNRHTFAVQFEVMKRFVTHGRTGGISASSMEGEGIPVQAASMNVRFLRSIGLLNVTERGMYVPTTEAIQFINARSVSDEKARPILAQLLRQTWFYELARTLFKTDPLIEEERFVGELAFGAKTDKTKMYMSLKTILDYLVYAGIIIKDERGLSWGTEVTPPQGSDPEVRNEVIPPLGQAPGTGLRSVEKGQAEPAGWHVLQTEDFYLRVRSDSDVVDDLVAHLETLKKKIERLKAQAKTEETA